MDEESAEITGRVTVGNIMVDGNGVGDVGNIVIRDRQRMADDGIIIIVMTLDSVTGLVLDGPDIVSRGFVYVRNSEALMDEMQRVVDEKMEHIMDRRITDWSKIKTEVKDVVGAVGVGFMKQLSADAAAQNHFLGNGEFNVENEELRSVQIRKHIEKYKADVKAVLSDFQNVEFPGLEVEGENFTLNVHGHAEKGVWERHVFESNIPVADVVLLTRMTTDIMNCEFDLANMLYKAVNADDFKFDQVRARVIPKATTVMQGDNYEADIFVAAYDSKADLRVKINGKEIVGDAADSGCVHWVVGTGGLGAQKYSGEIYVKKESGEVSNLAILGFILLVGGFIMAFIGMFLHEIWCIIGAYIATTGIIFSLVRTK